jgi:Ca2+-binding EF-hand superfamily protein
MNMNMNMNDNGEVDQCRAKLPRSWFSSLDVNGDGQVDFRDVRTFVNKLDVDGDGHITQKDIVAAIDTNGDGKLTRADLVAALDANGDGKLDLQDLHQDACAAAATPTPTAQEQIDADETSKAAANVLLTAQAGELFLVQHKMLEWDDDMWSRERPFTSKVRLRLTCHLLDHWKVFAWLPMDKEATESMMKGVVTHVLLVIDTEKLEAVVSNLSKHI